jgi:hypothetical protein
VYQNTGIPLFAFICPFNGFLYRGGMFTLFTYKTPLNAILTHFTAIYIFYHIYHKMVGGGSFCRPFGLGCYMRFSVKFRLYANFRQKWGKYMQFSVKISQKWWLVPFLWSVTVKNLTKHKRTPSV